MVFFLSMQPSEVGSIFIYMCVYTRIKRQRRQCSRTKKTAPIDDLNLFFSIFDQFIIRVQTMLYSLIVREEVQFCLIKPKPNTPNTAIKTKLLIYKTLLKPLWSYGLQLWGNAKKTNILKIQTFQNIALRKIINAPPFVSNHTLHTDLKLNTINDEAKTFYKRFHYRLTNHPNQLIKNLAIPSIPGNPTRRLKRKWCRDLLK